MKKCYKCHKTKKNEEFNKNKATKDGLQTYCRKCQKIENDKRFLKQKTKTPPPVYRFEKYCPKCDTVKYKKDFNKKTRAKDGLQYCCKKCQYKQRKHYMKDYNKKYYEKHYKKEHEVEHKIPVKIIEDKTHIGSAAYTATFNTAQAEQQRINEAYNKACEVYAKKIFYDEQKHPISLWERIKYVFKN